MSQQRGKGPSTHSVTPHTYPPYIHATSRPLEGGGGAGIPSIEGVPCKKVFHRLTDTHIQIGANSGVECVYGWLPVP